MLKYHDFYSDYETHIEWLKKLRQFRTNEDNTGAIIVILKSMPGELFMENWIFLGMSAAIFAFFQKLYRKMAAKNQFARPACTHSKCFKTCFFICVFIWISFASFCEYADFSNWQFPGPPQQSIAWNPGPTTLSKEVILAMRQLFELGLADPRGCEYKTVQVETGSV